MNLWEFLLYYNVIQNTINMVCAICGEKINGYGHNAYPVVEGTCCEKCNMVYVIPARINAIQNQRQS